MSYLVTVSIDCDHPGCMKRIAYERRNLGGLSKTFAGYLANEQDGWFAGAFPGDPKVAYCPEHRAEHGHPRIVE